mgnify:FL=1
MAPLFLYTLELGGGRWYVGTTAHPPRRLREHRGGRGSEWTNLHPPLGAFSRRYPLERLQCSPEEARLREDAKVKVMMLHHGVENVRGGSYSRANLSRSDVKGLLKELYHAIGGCLRCGHKSHWADKCFAATDVCGNQITDDEMTDDEGEEWGRPSPARRSPAVGRQSQRGRGLERERERTPRSRRRGGCRRCGRVGHTEDTCYARTTVDGETLDSGPEPEGADCCHRCGRAGHWSADCYAKADVNGNSLQRGRSTGHRGRSRSLRRQQSAPSDSDSESSFDSESDSSY